jgi:hypothetical protein
MFTRNSTFTDSVSITESGFTKVLRDLGSPVLDESGNDGGAYHAACVTNHSDPLMVLAIFIHESNAGTNPQAVCIRYDTKSWGNLRSDPYLSLGSVNTDRGVFQKYGSWRDGCRATAYHLNSATYRGLTIADAIAKWAPSSENDTEGYIDTIVSLMNQYSDISGRKPPMTRIIVSAGHENIDAITNDHLKAGDAEALHTATGALGTEAQYTGMVADALCSILRASGVDALRTDAIYHADVYDTDADLCVFIHGDGAMMQEPQHCGAAVVHAGPSTPDVDERAQAFVDAWNIEYTKVVTDERLSTNPTIDMTQYYGGWYRTGATPAIIIEQGVWGEAGLEAPDIPSPDVAANADAVAFASVLGFTVAGGSDVSRSGTGGSDTGGGDSGSRQRSATMEGNTNTGDWQSDGGGGRSKVFVIPGTVAIDADGYGIPGSGIRYVVAGGFGNFYRDNGFPTGTDNTGISPIFGLPITNEYGRVGRDGKPLTVQYFERARFEREILETDANGNVTKDRIVLGRIGVEALAAEPQANRPAGAWLS